jgi:predicted Zn-dependent protease
MQPQGQSGRAAAYRSLDVAQAALAKSDLRGARASLDRALAAEPGNESALSLRDEVRSREQERDSLLSAAHACVVQSRWNCVWHNAGKALSVDASSTEAKALVDRAIVESGAATAPAGPGPDNVEVPMVQ